LQNSRKARTIEAEQFIVRDSKGRARVTIGTAPVSGSAVSLSPDEPAVWFSDAKGRDRLILTTDGLRLANSKSQPALDVTEVQVRGSKAEHVNKQKERRLKWFCHWVLSKVSMGRQAALESPYSTPVVDVVEMARLRSVLALCKRDPGKRIGVEFLYFVNFSIG
jgi:hypothetical protein